MTRGSVMEYAAVVRDRYHWGNKMDKGKILDEFVKVTGLHRKLRMIIDTLAADTIFFKTF